MERAVSGLPTLPSLVCIAQGARFPAAGQERQAEASGWGFRDHGGPLQGLRWLLALGSALKGASM